MYEHIQFDVLGYRFRPRRIHDRYGCVFTKFTLAISHAAAKAARQESSGWPLQLKSDKSTEDLARVLNPVVARWVNYYCRFHPSAFNSVGRHINRAPVRWAMRKFKRLRGHKNSAIEWVERARIAQLMNLTPTSKSRCSSSRPSTAGSR